MSANFAVEENKDFVLKLTFESSKKDDHRTRRVKLPKIVDSNGKVSYEELVGLVIRLDFPAVNDDTSLSNEKKLHEVKLTYYDVDSDLIHLGSTEELIDAFDQYSKQRFLRINAKVERQRSPQRHQQQKQLFLPGSVLPDVFAETISSVAAAVSSEFSPAPSLSRISNSSDIHDRATTQDISIVNRLEKVPSKYAPSKEEQTNKIAAKHPEKEVKHVIKPAAENKNRVIANHVEHAFVNGGPKQPPPNDEINKPTATNRSTNNNKNNAINNNNSTSISKGDNSDQEVESKKDYIKGKKEKKEEKLSFIHGRHTCDSCMTTPIVGNRYHATNLPDYDICEKCHNAYEGTTIQFEVEKLVRDYHCQKRWQQRSERRAHRQGCASLWQQQGNSRCPSEKNINRKVEEKRKITEKETIAEKSMICPKPVHGITNEEGTTTRAFTEEDKSPIPLNVESCRDKTDAARSIASTKEKQTVVTKMIKESEDNVNQSKTETRSQCENTKSRTVTRRGTKRKVWKKYRDITDNKAPVKEEEQDILSEKKPFPHQDEKPTESNCQPSLEEEVCVEKQDSFAADVDGNISAREILGEILHKSAKGDMDSRNSREEENSSILSGCLLSIASSVSTTPSASTVSSDSVASSVSTASSIPTDVFSSFVLSDPYLDHTDTHHRWESQLKKLEELGFIDKNRCLEVFKRLEAVNIGMEIPDTEITVAQVVHGLFE